MTQGTAADPYLGRTLGGQYRIDALLGQGGMGRVYRGVQLSVQRPVAIKLIMGMLPHPPEYVERFRREAEATARLSHPNSVRLFDFGVSDRGELYMVMELLEGVDLSRQLREHGALQPLAALQIARQVLLALSEAHALGIVHRDIKPDNVFLARVHGGDTVAKVMDFGIAGMETGRSARLTGVGVVIGTPTYMSPEQAQGHPLDGRTDLYSVGVMLFEMLTGQQPFEPKTAVSLLLAHVTQPPKRLRDVGVQLPMQDSIQALLDGLLAKDPKQRPTIAGVLDVIATLAAAHVTAAQPLVAAARVPSSGVQRKTTQRPSSTRSLRAVTDSSAPMSTESVLRAANVVPWHKRLHGSGVIIATSGFVAAAAITLAVRAWPALTAATQQAQAAVVAPAELPVVAPKPLHTVTVASIPSGASVLVDGQQVGTTPYKLQLREPTDVSLTRRGYQRRLLHVLPEGEALAAVKLEREAPEESKPSRLTAALLPRLLPDSMSSRTAAAQAEPAQLQAAEPVDPPTVAAPPAPKEQEPPPFDPDKLPKSRGWLGPPAGPAYNEPTFAEREPRELQQPQQPPAAVDDPLKPCPVGRALVRAVGKLLVSTPPAARREQLRHEPLPYPNLRSARYAYDSREIDRDRYDEVIWMLRERRRQRTETEKNRVTSGDITSSEYEARLDRINAEFWGRGGPVSDAR